MADIITSLAVWQDFNIDGVPTAKLISQSEDDGIVTAKFYIEGEKTQSGVTDIFVKTAYKKGKTKLPAVIIYNDLPYSENDALTYKLASDGYLAVSVDIGGMTEGKEFYTVYPEEYSYANYDRKSFLTDVFPKEVKSSCWYRWGAAARYVFEYVKNQKAVGKIGIIGIGYSSTLVWQMTATVNGISAAASVLSNGWLAYKGVRKFGGSPDTVLSDEMLNFVAGVEAQSFAPHTDCPMLSLIPTNSPRFDCDRAYDTTARIKAEVYSALDYSVGYADGTDGQSASNLSLFLSKYLRAEKIRLPKEPQIKAEVVENSVSVEVALDSAGAVSVELYHSEGVDNPSLRTWRRTDKKAESECVKFDLEPPFFGERVYLFARVKYENGFTIGSDIICKKVQASGSAVKNKILYSGREIHPESAFVGIAGICVPSGIDIADEGRAQVTSGPMGIEGVSANGGIVTFKLNAEKDKPNDDAILMLDIYSKKPQTVTVKLTEDFFGKRAEYFSEIKLPGKRAWKNVMLEINKFKTAEGMILKSYASADALEIVGDLPFSVNNLLWV